MSFRDEGNAARARAAALAEELAEKEAELEALRAKLAQKDDELRGIKDEMSPVLDAERELAALKERGARRAEQKAREEAEAEKKRTEAGKQRDAEERERRRLASVSMWADVDLTMSAAFLALPTFWATFYLAVMHWKPFLLLPAGVFLVLLAVKNAGRRRAQRQWRLEQAWAKSHPYALVGYPELLERRPESPPFRTFSSPGDAHQAIEIEIELRDEPGSDDLERVLKGCDVELDSSSPFKTPDLASFDPSSREQGDDDVRRVYARPSPITTQRSRGGSVYVVDHNRAIVAWVHRLQDEVLTRLHARYGVERVVLRVR